jgi:hypothetical protein
MVASVAVLIITLLLTVKPYFPNKTRLSIFVSGLVVGIVGTIGFAPRLLILANL